MKHLAVVLAACAVFFNAQALADTGDDPIAWLGRIASAGQRLDYTGIFIYQSGQNFETSRITHIVDASGEHERLEVLDGSPREVVRTNNEVRCVLPDQKTVIIDRAGGQRAFPARLPASFSAITENYRVTKGEVSRVAGLESQLIVLEPRDDLRYGHMLWADTLSGLLLKARMVDENGEVIEQFTFTDVRIGGGIDAEALKPRYSKDADWRVIDAQGHQMRAEESPWILTAPLPGYTLKSIVKRPLGRERGDILHLVFSDGLAAISVFVEPIDPDRSAAMGLGPLASGPINIYKRTVDDHLITVLGEVPLRAVQRLGDGMERSTR